EKAVGRIPGEGAACLGTKQDVVNAEIQDRVRVGPRARVRSEEQVTAFERVAGGNLHRVVVVPLQTCQPKIAAEAAALVDKCPAVVPSLIEELNLEVNRVRQFPFHAQ